jgi:hypothetical protein
MSDSMKGVIYNRPFFQGWFSLRKGWFQKLPFLKGQFFRKLAETLFTPACHQESLAIYEKKANIARVHASQNGPLIVEKGEICNRPFF